MEENMDDQDKGTGPAHLMGSHKGEEDIIDNGPEPGRTETVNSAQAGGAPVRTRTARDSTGVADTEPISPDMPDMPPA
jgi:hypothetical protein